MRHYRHEIKYIINKKDAEVLKQRLNLIMNIDQNGYFEDGSYLIKSLYFDDLDNNSYFEKLNGVLYRKKYRIRIYNDNYEKILLERKFKHNNLTSKDNILISSEIYSKIIEGKIDEISLEENNLLSEFIGEIKAKRLVPSVIVKYKRLAFTYPISNIRITFDENIAGEGANYDLFLKDASNFKVLEPNEVVLEVKYDEILPKSIASIISSISLRREAVSKFQRSKDKI